MKFLFAFVALLGAASANWIAPFGYLNPGDVQAAVIDTNAAVRDNVRTVGEINARAAEVNRDIYVAANHNAIAAAQHHAAGASAAFAANAAHAANYGRINNWGATPWGASALAGGHWGAAPWGGLGVGVW